MSKSKCDCLNYCGDDHWLEKGLAEPCKFFKERQRAAELEAQRSAALAALPAKLLASLKLAEDFIAGFEDDESQEGINERLAMIRKTIKDAEELL
jgi:hypothetical protein